MSSPTSRRRDDDRQRFHPVDYGEAQWQRMLRHALEHSDRFECALPYRVVRQQNLDAPLWPATLEAYRGDLLSRHASLVRWGRMQERPVEIARFRISTALRRFVLGPRRLTDWTWEHSRPEDPTFLAADEPILSTESVHGRITVFATADEQAQLASGGVRLVEPLGVRAEPWPTP